MRHWKIIGAIVAFLGEGALQVSGYTNIPLAIFLALLVIGLALWSAWPLIERKFRHIDQAESSKFESEIHTGIQAFIKRGSDISERFRYGSVFGAFGYQWPFTEFEEWREEVGVFLSKYGYNDEGVLWYRYVSSLDTKPPLPIPIAEACKKGLELLEKMLQY